MFWNGPWKNSEKWRRISPSVLNQKHSTYVRMFVYIDWLYLFMVRYWYGTKTVFLNHRYVCTYINECHVESSFKFSAKTIATTFWKIARILLTASPDINLHRSVGHISNDFCIFLNFSQYVSVYETKYTIKKFKVAFKIDILNVDNILNLN